MIGTTPSASTSSSGITAPMNINAVIAHLVEMTPPQRKQFAQMHMDDPMMLSAAKFVDNQISKQAAAMSAQRMGAAPPPVNQQVVAQMSPQPPAPQAAPMPQAASQPQGQAQPLPENTGIAQLPAQNMQGMADGGIVGYADRGAVDLGSILDQARASDKAAEQKLNSYGLRQQSQDPQGYQAAQAARQAAAAARATAEKAYTADMEAKGVGKPISAATPIGAFKDLSAGVPALLDRNAPAYTGPNIPAVVAAPPAPTATKNDRTPSTKDKYTPPAPPEKKTEIDQLRADKIPSAPPSMARATVNASDEDGAAAYDKILKAQADPRSNLPPEIQANANLAKAQGEKELASADKRALGLQALVDERNTRLAGREKYVKDQEELNPNMSLITAGLAMMQSTGKGLAGLAEGATKGVAQYMEGVKYNSAQRQKLEDARDALADLKFNQENMTEKERLAAQNTITQGAIAANNAVVNTIQHREGVNAQTAAHLFDAHARQSLEGQRQQFEMGQQKERLDSQERLAIAQMNNAIKAAGISASAPLATKLAFLEKLGAAPEDSALYKGFARSEQESKEPRMYAEYQKLASDEIKGPEFLKRNPTFEAYKAGMSSTGGGSTINKAGWGQAVKN